MGGNQAAEEVDTPKQGKPVDSMALTLFGNENLSVGEPWSTGLFDCHENQTNAIVTACLPCITFGQIAEILDGGEMTCPLGTFIYMLMMPPLCSQWIMGSKYRTKLRKKYHLSHLLSMLFPLSGVQRAQEQRIRPYFGMEWSPSSTKGRKISRARIQQSSFESEDVQVKDAHFSFKNLIRQLYGLYSCSCSCSMLGV